MMAIETHQDILYRAHLAEQFCVLKSPRNSQPPNRMRSAAVDLLALE